MSPKKPNAIKTWHVVIGGFLQTKGTANGMIGLWQRLKEFSNPSTHIIFGAWNEDYSSLAELIWRAGEQDTNEQVNINIYCYSWGGTASLRLSKELKSRGLTVQNLVMCDPVYRPRFFSFKFLAMLPWPKLLVPANVKNVFWFHQTNPRFSLDGEPIWKIWKAFHPAGHEVLTSSEDTVVVGPMELVEEHIYCDDNPEFQNTCLELAQKFIE